MGALDGTVAAVVGDHSHKVAEQLAVYLVQGRLQQQKSLLASWSSDVLYGVQWKVAGGCNPQVYHSAHFNRFSSCCDRSSIANKVQKVQLAMHLVPG